MQKEYPLSSKESPKEESKRKALDTIWNQLSEDVKKILKKLFKADVSYSDIRKYVLDLSKTKSD